VRDGNETARKGRKKGGEGFSHAFRSHGGIEEEKGNFTSMTVEDAICGERGGGEGGRNRFPLSLLNTAEEKRGREKRRACG